MTNAALYYLYLELRNTGKINIHYTIINKKALAKGTTTTNITIQQMTKTIHLEKLEQ